jgi:hypothetical protein
MLYKALEPGTDDDRMKGALWLLNAPAFGTERPCLVCTVAYHPILAKYAISGERIW